MSFGSYRYSPASASALSDNIDTAIVAMGWTLHDTVAATDRVYYSQGESGAKTKEYIRVKVNSNNIEFYAYLFWDAATNTGYGQAYSSASYIYITWSSSTKWVISGDKDIVVICKVGASAGADFMFFGHLPTPLWSTPLATTSNAEVAGAGVVIEVSSTTDFVVNKAYLIVDPTTGCRERILVTAISAGVSITATLANNYAAGSFVGAVPSSFGATLTSAHTNAFSPTCPFDVAAGTAQATATAVMDIMSKNSPLTSTIIDPDYLLGYQSGTATGLYVLTPIGFQAYNGVGFVAYCDKTLVYAPVATNDYIYCINQQDSGTTTADGETDSTHLHCHGKAWTIDAYIGKQLVISDGTGANQTRYISDNSADVLTVATAFDTTPNGTSVFYIIDQTYRVIMSTFAMREAY